MRSRIATIFTMALLVAGTGGAIAIGSSGSPGGPLGGAASAQYCNGKSTNHSCTPKPKHNCGKHHNQKCPSKPKKKATNSKKSHKPAPKHHKATKKPTQKKPTSNKGGSSNCTIRTQNGLTVLYCP